MSDKRYPTRIHEALGVETGEVFECEGRTWTINESGVLSIVNKRPGCYEVVGPSAVCIMINHPERITRRPRLTEEQVAQLKALNTLGFKWLAKQRKGCVMFFQKKPHKNAIWFSGTGDEQEDYGVVLPNDTHLSSLVSWSDPAPLDIVQTLRDAGVEVDDVNPDKLYPDDISRRIDIPPSFDSVRTPVKNQRGSADKTKEFCMMANQCVHCGQEMPEGDQVCGLCRGDE